VSIQFRKREHDKPLVILGQIDISLSIEVSGLSLSSALGSVVTFKLQRYKLGIRVKLLVVSNRRSVAFGGGEVDGSWCATQARCGTLLPWQWWR